MTLPGNRDDYRDIEMIFDEPSNLMPNDVKNNLGHLEYWSSYLSWSSVPIWYGSDWGEGPRAGMASTTATATTTTTTTHLSQLIITQTP
jgi:hypothetical protein